MAKRRSSGGRKRGGKPATPAPARPKAAPRRRGAPPARRAPKAFSAVKETERAARRIGEANIKPGAAITVARSGRVGLSKRGFRSKSVSKVIDKIEQSPRSPLYSYTARLRYKGRDRKVKTATLSRVGVPLPESVQELRRRNKKTGRLESTKAATKRIIRDNIAKWAHGTVAAHYGGRGETNPRRLVATGRYTWESARRRLAAIKKREGASITVEFVRHGRAPKKEI